MTIRTLTLCILFVLAIPAIAAAQASYSVVNHSVVKTEKVTTKTGDSVTETVTTTEDIRMTPDAMKMKIRLAEIEYKTRKAEAEAPAKIANAQARSAVYMSILANARLVNSDVPLGGYYEPYRNPRWW